MYGVLALSAAAVLVLPSATAFASGKSHSHNAGASVSVHGHSASSKSDHAPLGNNGHIQLDEYAMDGSKGNDARLSCGFSVSFFGYDTGTQQATITVTAWAPTDGGAAFTAPTSWTTLSWTGGSQFDQNVQISPSQLATAFAGITPAHNGYHARVEVEVTGSQGSNDKFHMVWITPCATAPVAPLTSTTNTGSSAGTSSDVSMGFTVATTEELSGSTSGFVQGPINVVVGDTIEYHFVVTNTGNQPLAISASSATCDTGTITPAGPQTIAVGASMTFGCTKVVTAVPASGVFINTITTTGANAQGASAGTVTTSALSRVSAPALRIKKLAAAKVAKPVLRAGSFTG